MRALTRATVLTLSLALTSGVVGAQQDQIPKELALALIPFGASDGGEIMVGQLPLDLASTFALPAGGRVLGSFVSLSYAQVAMTLPGGLDSATAFARRSLVEHGWVPRPQPAPRLGGLQYGPPRNALPTIYCKPGSEDAITISAQFHGQSTLLRLTRNSGSTICDPTRLSGGVTSGFNVSGATAERVEFVQSSFAEMPLATVPPLWSPGDFRAAQVCRPPSSSIGPESQSQLLRTEMSLPEILAYYGKQLDSAGWKPSSVNDSSVTGSWTNPPSGQQ
ncbi:MAG TPA: hypothetical protein VJO33_12725, partial [Gemmatimonadaceae bacterium]|nr:hypothetical protein [Gemmatimonadaceae bacterium]